MSRVPGVAVLTGGIAAGVSVVDVRCCTGFASIDLFEHVLDVKVLLLPVLTYRSLLYADSGLPALSSTVSVAASVACVSSCRLTVCFDNFRECDFRCSPIDVDCCRTKESIGNWREYCRTPGSS